MLEFGKVEGLICVLERGTFIRHRFITAARNEAALAKTSAFPAEVESNWRRWRRRRWEELKDGNKYIC